MTAGIGDNSRINATAQGKLKALVARIERLEEDKRAVTDDIGEVYKEAKGEGFDASIIRAAVRMRREDKAKRQTREALIDLYLTSIGGIDAEL